MIPGRVEVRIHEPGLFSTADIGRVFMIHYWVQTRLEFERRIFADYGAHCRAIGGAGVVLATNDFPPLPLPPVDVRAHWREALRTGPGVEAFAVVSRGLVGLAAAAMTTLLEHAIDPTFGVRFRTFTRLPAALEWLGSVSELGASPEAISEQLEALRELS